MTTKAALGFSEYTVSSFDNQYSYTLAQQLYGWPFRSLARDSCNKEGFSDWPVGPRRVQGWRGGWMPGEDSRRLEPLILPLVPLPIGFTLNSVLFATAGYGAAHAYRRARASRRARRGRCTQCGYPVEQLAKCPECGTPTILANAHAH